MKDLSSIIAGFVYRVRRRLLPRLLLSIATLVALCLGILCTEPGARLLWRLAVLAVPGSLSGELEGGTLHSGLQLNNLVYRDSKRIVNIDTFSAGWHWSYAPLKLTVDHLRIGTLDLDLLPAPPEPVALPAYLMLPLAIDMHSVTLRQLIMRRKGEAASASDIRLNASSDRRRHILTLVHAGTPYGVLQSVLRLDGSPPFATSGSASLAGRWHDERYRVDLQFGGTLQNLALQLTASGDRINGSAAIEAAPFASSPLRRAQVKLHRFNPQLFIAGAPRAELDLAADLAPSSGTAGSADQASPLAVTGPVSLSNKLPGSFDLGLLPLASATAELRLDARHSILSRLEIRLTGGTLDGGGEMDHAGKGHFAVRAGAIDLHALHARLKPTRLNGTLQAEIENQAQRIALDLTGGSQAINADIRIDPQHIALKNAQLTDGAARLDISGTLARDEPRSFAFNGRLSDFNPARLLAAHNAAGVANAIPDARINAEIELQGRLQPEPSAQLRFKVIDSTYAGLPMDGAGRLGFVGPHRLDADAHLAVAGNRLSLKGTFGVPAQRLKFDIDAPALNRLGFGLSGLLQAAGELGGTAQRPAIDASIRAEKLLFGQDRLAYLDGRIRTQGVPGRNPDARVVLELDARDIRHGDIGLNRISATVDGSYASHGLKLAAHGQLHGRPLQLELAAHGRLQEQPQGYAWDGQLERLDNRGFPRLSLARPVSVSLAPHRLTLGAMQLTLEQAQLDLKSLRLDDAAISSEGAFTGLDLGHVLELQREITGQSVPLKTDLVLDGHWKLTLAESADGFFQLERRSGDIRISNGSRDNALGFRKLLLRSDLQGQTASLALHASTERVGNVEGQAQVGLQRAAGRLLPIPDSRLSARIAAQIPRLQSLASLAGPKIGMDGSIAITLAADGTLIAPRLSGDAVGSNLALTFHDQGIRLRDGSARLRLDDNIVELQQLELRGGGGIVRVSGRIPLAGDTARPSVSIVAERLQLLSKPSAQLTISGRAEAVEVDGQLAIKGNVRADNARFRLPEKSAPALDDDVVLIRGKERGVAGTIIRPSALPASERPAGPLTPRIAIEFDLGDDFRFAGSGADVLLGGTLAIESVPGESPKATGTVQVVEGSYEAFGTRLDIERGTLNFHRSFSNPDLNILAMRRDKEVAAGVQVTGTVNQPRVQLVSEPEVAEEEKLSWLVFGRAGSNSDAGAAQAQAAAKEAALGLFNRVGGARIAKGVGLDQLAFGSSEFGLGAQQVVSLGKEISNRLFIGYEQSLAGAAGVLKLTYDWSRHWSVVVRGGSIGGFDLLYNKRFDAAGAPAERR